MGCAESKPQGGIIADPPSVWDLERVEDEKAARQAGPEQVQIENTSEALVERVLQLELENARLREHLQLLAGAKATGAPATEPGGAGTQQRRTLTISSVEDEHRNNKGRTVGASNSTLELPNAGVTDAEVEMEAEAADLSSSWKVEIEPEPRNHCTVINVQAPERTQLLADISRILNGLGLVIADAHISTDGDDAFDVRWQPQHRSPRACANLR